MDARILAQPGSEYRHIQNVLTSDFPSRQPFPPPCTGLQDLRPWKARYALLPSKDPHHLLMAFCVYGCVVFHIDLPHLVVEHTKPAVKMKKKNMIIVCYVWGRGSGRSGYHIKTPWAQKSSINCIWAISSSQYNNSLHQKLQDTFLVQRKGIYEIWQGESFECHRQTKYVRGTVASSKPSISVNRVDKSLSPTVALPLEFPLGPVLNDYKLQY